MDQARGQDLHKLTLPSGEIHAGTSKRANLPRKLLHRQIDLPPACHYDRDAKPIYASGGRIR